MNRRNRSTIRIRTRDGAELHCETVIGDADSWLVAVHGIGEHIGRENHLPRLFADRYNILRFDLRGHGKSDGRRGYVDSFDVYYRDLEDVVDWLASAYPKCRYDLFGHSMGALIAAGFAQRRTPGVPVPERLFLASPPIGIGGRGGALLNRLPRLLFTWLAKLPFSLPLSSAINRSALSHENAVSERLEDDPLSLKQLHTKLLFNLVEASKQVFSRPIASSCPIYGAVGSDDRIVSSKEALGYFSKHEPEADFRVIEGAYHEPHNESESYRKPYFAFLTQALGGE